MHTIKPSLKQLKVAAYFNSRTQMWVARYALHTLLPFANQPRKDCYYGYGHNMVTALCDLLHSVYGPYKAKILVRQPDKTLVRLHLYDHRGSL